MSDKFIPMLYGQWVEVQRDKRRADPSVLKDFDDDDIIEECGLRGINTGYYDTGLDALVEVDTETLEGELAARYGNRGGLHMDHIMLDRLQWYLRQGNVKEAMSLIDDHTKH